MLIPGRRSTCFCRAVAGSAARARTIATPKILNFTTEAPSFCCGYSGSCNYHWAQIPHPVQNFGFRPRMAFEVIWGITKINTQLIPFSNSSASGAILHPGKIRREEPCDFIEVKVWLQGAAGLSLARRNCGVIDDQIYIVDVDVACAIRRADTARPARPWNSAPALGTLTISVARTSATTWPCNNASSKIATDCRCRAAGFSKVTECKRMGRRFVGENGGCESVLHELSRCRVDRRSRLLLIRGESRSHFQFQRRNSCSE